MKQAEVEAIAYEIVDYFTTKQVIRVIEAVEEAPNSFVLELERLIGKE